MNATQRILVKLACSMEEEALQTLMSLSDVKPAIRETYSTPIGYLMYVKEHHPTINSFVEYLEKQFLRSPRFSNFHAIVREHWMNCEKDDLTAISNRGHTSESTAEQRKDFKKTMLKISEHITRQHWTIMAEVSLMNKNVKELLKNSLDVLDKMKECGCINENNVDYLKDLLGELKLVDPLRLLNGYENKYPPVRYPPNYGQRPAIISHQPSMPTVPRREVRYHTVNNNSTRRAGERPYSFSPSLNHTHSAASGSEDDFLTASGSPMPRQNPSSNQNASQPHSACLSRFRNVLSIPYNGTYPGETRSTQPVHLPSNETHSHSSQQQQLVYLNNAHFNSPTPEPSAPFLEELPRQHSPRMRSRGIMGGACIQTPSESNMNNYPSNNSTPLSSFVGSGDFFCQPEVRQNSLPMEHYHPVHGISNSFVRSALHNPNHTQESLGEKGAEDNRMNSLCSSMHPVAVRHEERTLLESGSMIVQSRSSPPSCNILIPSGSTQVHQILPLVESSGSEEDIQVRKRNRKGCRRYSGTHSKKLKRGDNRWKVGNARARVGENVTCVTTEESDDDYHTAPGED